MIRVAVASRASRRASMGMRAYARALLERVPRVAPDVETIPVDAPFFALPFALRRVSADLVHLPYLDAPPFVPRPYVAMVHDLIHLRFPELFSRATAAYWRAVAAPMYDGAARLLVSDPRVADDLTMLLGVARDRIRVVPLGYGDAVPSAEPWHAVRPYVFYAGNHSAHKGLDTLYTAWHALPERITVDLVLTGPDEPAVRARYARRSGSIAFLGEIDDDTLARRYRGALAYVQPSLAEGFGIPALEAAAAGTPVVGTRSGIPEAVIPFAGVFAPGDAGALLSLLTAVVDDPDRARHRAAEGAVVLRAYTWDRFAAATAEVFREVVCP